MRRDAMQQLYDWKEKTTRKPLIVRGARQVGKTWLMKEFASSAYRQFAYINFEDNEVMKDVFQKDFDVERILMAIQLVTGIVVDTETLIIFDEIQEAPRGLTALKYFQEKAPQYHVVAAGSLLGIAMHSNDSFPSGRSILWIYILFLFRSFWRLSGKRLLPVYLQKRLGADRCFSF